MIISVRELHNKIKFTILIICILLVTNTLGQKGPKNDFCLSNDELTLFDFINQLRKDYGKDLIQLSASLSYVANIHVNDLQTNNPDSSICNSSSWSDKGTWTPCCYNKYVYNPDCMWDKPKELTSYTYRGYELVTYFADGVNVDSISQLWSDSKPVLDMLLTRGDYEKKKWICGGLSIGTNYVSLWFGQRKDRLPSPVNCENEKRSPDTLSTIVKLDNSNIFYLIFGSYPDMHSAREALKEVSKKGFNNAGILDKNKKFRVYLNKYNSLKEAMFDKERLPFEFKEAWILKE
jgi:sporulation related protein